MHKAKDAKQVVRVHDRSYWIVSDLLANGGVIRDLKRVLSEATSDPGRFVSVRSLSKHRNQMRNGEVLRSDPDSSVLKTSGISGRLRGSFFQHRLVRDHILEVNCGWSGFSGRMPCQSLSINSSSLYRSNGSLLVNIWRFCLIEATWTLGEEGGVTSIPTMANEYVSDLYVGRMDLCFSLCFAFVDNRRSSGAHQRIEPPRQFRLGALTGRLSIVIDEPLKSVRRGLPSESIRMFRCVPCLARRRIDGFFFFF